MLLQQKKKTKRTDMTRYIHYRSIKNTSLEREVYKTNTIIIKSAKGQTFTIPNVGALYVNGKKLLPDQENTFVSKNDNNYTIHYNNVMFELVSSQYITRKGNEFQNVNSENITSLKEFKLRKPNKRECFLMYNVAGTEDVGTNYEVQVRKHYKGYNNNSRKWVTVYKSGHGSIPINKLIYKFRFISNKGNRSDWTYCFIKKDNLNDSNLYQSIKLLQ